MRLFLFNGAYTYYTGRTGKDVDRRYADDFRETALTLKGYLHCIYMWYRTRYISMRAKMRNRFPLVFGKPTQMDLVYELWDRPYETKIVEVMRVGKRRTSRK